MFYNFPTKLFIGLLLTVFSSLAYAIPPFVKGQVLVQAPSYELSAFNIERELPRSGIKILSVDSGKEWGQVQALRKKGFKAGLNLIATAFEVPTDSLYSYQWHMPRIQVEQAWDLTKGQGVKVAVLDSGIKTGGTDGISQCGGYNVITGGSPVDGSSSSHGTHVAGTIAQLTTFAPDTGVGTVGVAPQACILVVKVLSDSGSGTFADIAEGIYYAVDNGAHVINMSLGVSARYGITSDTLMDAALDYAEQNNVVVVAAAGNDSFRKNVSYPAIYPSVVAVGATDFVDNLARYSNRGTGIDIVAPGGDTGADLNGDGYGDGVLQETCCNSAGEFGYYFFQGTSMASPHVAGVAALVIANGKTAVTQVREALFSSAKDLGSSGYDTTYGYGLVQAASALGSGGSVSQTFNAASNPQPDLNTTGVELDVTLSWLSDTKAVSNEIYFWSENESEPTEPTVVLSGNTYTPAPLAYFTLYNWKVISIDSDNNTVVSPTWYFTTKTDPSSATDADGDGYTVEGGDCDDNNADVYPGHQDTKGRWGRDGVDNDCNNIIDG